MEELKQQPLTEEQSKDIADVARAKAEMIHRAYQSHTRGLFWFWLILVLLPSWVGFGILFKKPEPDNASLALGIMFWLILVTGGYVFQEVRKLHWRIDGLLNLIEKK